MRLKDKLLIAVENRPVQTGNFHCDFNQVWTASRAGFSGGIWSDGPVLLSVIRHWAFRDQVSIRKKSRRRGLSRNTIRKYMRLGSV